jgi:hypothetical protein
MAAGVLRPPAPRRARDLARDAVNDLDDVLTIYADGASSEDETQWERVSTINSALLAKIFDRFYETLQRLLVVRG